MAYIHGEARGQQTLFPTSLDELIPVDHVCRVIEALVGRLDMAALSFERAEPAATGRSGYAQLQNRRTIFLIGAHATRLGHEQDAMCYKRFPACGQEQAEKICVDLFIAVAARVLFFHCSFRKDNEPGPAGVASVRLDQNSFCERSTFTGFEYNLS